MTISTAIGGYRRQAYWRKLAVDVSLKSLWSMAEAVKVGQGGYVDIVDNKGKLLAHPDKEKGRKNESVSDRAYIAAVMQGQSGSQESAFTGGRAGADFVLAGPSHWLSAYYPSGEAQLAWDHHLDNGGLDSFGGSLCRATAVYSAKSLAQPPQVLDEAAERMAAGDLSQFLKRKGRNYIWVIPLPGCSKTYTA